MRIIGNNLKKKSDKLPNDGNGLILSFSGEKSISQLTEALAINVYEGGVIEINDRQMKITGNVINGSAVNMGDSVSQTVNWGAQEAQTYEKLLSEIKTIPGLSIDEVQDATEILGDLKKKSEEGTLRLTFLQRMWDQLPKAITMLESAIKVYNTLNP
ncbi:hypothetical protein SPSYN_00907 [Sporotomaculum syntrophicum]|uniref:Uncharacterized protein n=1 Tax=Sporotomaculum syntrophicum TaxID=182264 RepID=A0A9D2WSM4_9FIRM|nr:hypothetical protein SPSYN_00907 [Sporotomaculum syntrophicum]